MPSSTIAERSWMMSSPTAARDRGWVARRNRRAAWLAVVAVMALPAAAEASPHLLGEEPQGGAGVEWLYLGEAPHAGHAGMLRTGMTAGWQRARTEQATELGLVAEYAITDTLHIGAHAAGAYESVDGEPSGHGVTELELEGVRALHHSDAFTAVAGLEVALPAPSPLRGERTFGAAAIAAAMVAAGPLRLGASVAAGGMSEADDLGMSAEAALAICWPTHTISPMVEASTGLGEGLSWAMGLHMPVGDRYGLGLVAPVHHHDGNTHVGALVMFSRTWLGDEDH